MNTIQLECFITVAEYLNFSRASEVLRITQPAVSHQIQSLEEELDVRLFNRTSKTVSLTPEGIRFLPDAELILKTAVSAKERLCRREGFLPFEIGCHNRMEINLLPPILQKLTREFPLLRPSVRLMPFPSLLNLIENKQIHASFGIKEEQKYSALSFTELSCAPVACICAPEHPMAQYRTLTKKQLSGNLIACPPRQISGAVFTAQNVILTRLPAEQCYFTENIESALTLAKANVGYTLYPDVAPAREPGLCYIPVTDLPGAVFGVYHRYDNDHPVQKRFLSLCREIIS
ncbi:LysR family transcriptional regulator [Clostridium sp. Marseille-P3244]|uniref:LysR family transcriptional regulator n=1 Tax=Clostridium sp. Marseille-P3244 TaxID=1871020 RepID=UPI000931D2B6|nr:LysR family transcriptional regulator [Clostridium sp. Marseille-P3244]